MSIKVKYYYHDGGDCFKPGEVLTIKNRKIYLNAENNSTVKHFSFFYDDTSMLINSKQNDNIKKVQINRILTENAYRFGQNQYLIHMNWMQQQKLLWMFQRHWLQQSRNAVQLLILFIIIALAGIGYSMIHHL
ncbi:MAG: hypothetical protein IPK10_03455 [Bacteroidetes bacterium]|nr:hypothetical protein [Bacteroidota bacterium]